VEIIVGDAESTVFHPRKHLKELSVIRSVCKARPKGYYHMPRYKMGMWDGYISLMQSFSSFPTGLLSYALKALDAKGYDYSIRDTRKSLSYNPVIESMLRGISLRDYQIYAANTLLDNKCGIAKMATNSGKTEVMAAIIEALGCCKTTVVVHRKELLYQTHQRFDMRLISAHNLGIIGDGVWDPGDITIAMVQTLSNTPDDVLDYVFKDNMLLMVDECHHASSDQMMDVLLNIPGSYRFGFSGTPLKMQDLPDLKLIGLTGEVLVDIDNDYLIKHGYSAEPMVNMMIIESDDGWDSDYQDAYSEYIVNSTDRNNAIANFAINSSGLILILVNYIEHGKTLNKMIPDSVFVNGSDSTEYRQEVIQNMRESSKGVVIATAIFDEGIDVPGVDVVILAAGGSSHIKLLQRVGRGLRKKQGDNQLVILDFLDDTNKYLLNHSEERINTYVKEKFKINLL
jgi:superfamily II DNA or RNA helicase